MNISAGLIGKGLIALGAVGATGGVAVLASAVSKKAPKAEIAPKNPISMETDSVEKEEITQLKPKESAFPENDFSKKVEDIMKKVRLNEWCERKGAKLYVCDKEKSHYELNRIKLSSKQNDDEYTIQWGYTGVEMKIMEFNDGVTFPGKIGFMLNNEGKLLKADRKGTGSKEGPSFINIGPKGELKFDDKKKALVWAWEDVNDLANKAGLNCEVSKKKCTTIENKKINIVDAISNGRKRSIAKGVTLEGKGVEWTYGDNFNTFQGYGFTPHADITVKYDNDSKVTTGEKIVKINKNTQYRITRDASNVTD